jgi:hypothetical protein
MGFQVFMGIPLFLVINVVFSFHIYIAIASHATLFTPDRAEQRL